MANPLPELERRGLIYQKTHPELGAALAAQRFTLYVGFDPTADSLHLGHLVPLLCLARFQRAGHRPIALVGGGTGMVGDPSGRASERILLAREDLERNVPGIEKQCRAFLDFDDRDTGALLLNNYDWLGTYPLVDFLRDVGKHFSVGVMLGKESVRTRLEAGISFTEFAYVLLQSYDFLHLFDHYGCRLQVGGQDQWGNITAGMDLIRRVRGAEAYGATCPLVTRADGSKFGKTEAGSVWLDPERTTPYELYQYFVNTDDRDVVTYLAWFTFLPEKEIESYRQAVTREPESREAQRRLAREVTSLIHGEPEARAAEEASAVLFGKEIGRTTDESLEKIFPTVPRHGFPASVLGEGLSLVEAMVEASVARSRGEARRLVSSGAIYVNNRRVSDPGYCLGMGDLASAHMLLLRRGKRSFYLFRFGEKEAAGQRGPGPAVEEENRGS